jgi:hypothetical protein
MRRALPAGLSAILATESGAFSETRRFLFSKPAWRWSSACLKGLDSEDGAWRRHDFHYKRLRVVRSDWFRHLLFFSRDVVEIKRDRFASPTVNSGALALSRIKMRWSMRAHRSASS